VSARPTNDAYVVAETVRLRRDLPMVDTVTDVTYELAWLTGTGATRTPSAMSSLRHAAWPCPGDSSRQPRPWRAAMAIGSCTTGGIDNGRAIGFAKKFGFRSTGFRRRRLMNRHHQRRRY
jgi:hypothetical protein